MKVGSRGDYLIDKLADLLRPGRCPVSPRESNGSPLLPYTLVGQAERDSLGNGEITNTSCSLDRN